MRKSIYILVLLLSTAPLHANTHVPDSARTDSAISQGVNLKLDIFNTAYYLISSKGTMQTYEIAANVQLKQRFFPTLELGYAKGKLGVLGAMWEGQGGWANVGLDINGLKKNVNNLSALLVGIRIGTSVQQYDLCNLPLEDSYWKEHQVTQYNNKWRTECWGEIVAGCQVNVYSGLVMGWNARLKLLFTRKVDSLEPTPYFVPGYGYRDKSQWGFNYYIGWKF